MKHTRWIPGLLIGCTLSTLLTPPAGAEPMEVRISPGHPSMAADGKLPQAKTSPLGAEELAQLLRRLPQLQAADKKPFALREGSKPAPRTARSLPAPFPPADRKPVPSVHKEELKVTAFAPEGPIEMAPHMTVTFNQPMVPLTTLEQLALTEVPLKLSPQPPGKWRWLGTQTLMFVPDGRFPMATRYQVEIPTSASSQSGQKLAAPKSFAFQTPTLKLESHYPSARGQGLTTPLFLRFNQDIDRQELARLIQVTSGGRSFAYRLASSDEVAAHSSLRGLSRGLKDRRWLALVPVQPLPAGTTFTVSVPAGAPSAEGPLKTESPISYSFATYDPLQVTHEPGTSQPLQPWHFHFNNGLDSSKFDPASVKVTPELPGMQVMLNGNSLMVRGRSKGRSNYTVTLPASLTDVFGQTLGKNASYTVKVGSSSPAFQGPNQAFLVLDPQGKRELVASVINQPRLKLKVWRVGPSSWDSFTHYLQNFRHNPKELKEPGELLSEREIEVNAQPDELTDVKIDLSEYLPQGLGHIAVRLEPPASKEYPYPQAYVGWIQSTQIGLDAMADHRQMQAWASDLATGKSLPGVEFSLGESRAQSGADGLATLPLTGSAHFLVARKGNDVALLPREFSYWYSYGWEKVESGNSTLWHVFDDRHLYKPGEKVSVKGWMRLQQYGPRGQLVGTTAKKISYRVEDSQGNEILKGETQVGGLGGFNFSFDLPKTVNLGATQIELQGDDGSSHVHSFQVEEFRRPEFEVSASASNAAVVAGESATVSTQASYYAGGGLANAKVNWSVTTTPTSYSPPHWSEFSFGTWTPWWSYRRWWDEGGSSSDVRHTSYESRTDGKGSSAVRLEFPPSGDRPVSVQAQASVQDVNRQAWSATTSLLVHPSTLYVGIKNRRTFVEKGQPLDLSFVVTDLDGKPVAGKTVVIKSYRLDWEGSWGQPKVKHVDESTRQIVSAAQPVQVQVPTGEGGTYQIEAEVFDTQNRRNRSQMTAWVAGGKQPPSRSVEQETVTLVPSKKEYLPGESAEILVQAPFAPAELVVTTRRNGIASTQRLSAPNGSTTVKVPLEELHIPSLQVQVDAIGSKVRVDANGQELPGKPQRPAFATASLNLAVSRSSRQLAVEVKPGHSHLKPGEQTTVDVRLKDDQGRPVSGEVALVMVDEAVLALTGHNPADPLNSFCVARSSDVFDAHLRRWVLLNQIDETTIDTTSKEISRNKSSLPSGMADGMMAVPSSAPRPAPSVVGRMRSEAAEVEDRRSPAEPIKMRTNFTPLALFVPSLRTDSEGRAQVKVKLPDNLTRYRLVALAASGEKQFGKGESSLTARQPLMVRPSAPRFLNFGDRFELPVVVQNQTDQPMQVSVGCRASNLKISNGGYRVTVPAQDRVEVRFPAAAEEAGTARFQVAASSTQGADAAEITLPVWTPATTEAFATYGTLDEGAISQPIEKPAQVFPQFGSLTVTTSSTALAELTDAFLYLNSYPFECSEQISSRVLASAALKDVLEAFQAPGMPSRKELTAAMERDMERLRGQQNYDGGWDYWVREKPSIPFLSVHVTHALVRTRAKGFKVDERMLEQALGYLNQIESHIPSSYSETCKRSIRAYALYVLELAGKGNAAKARALAQEKPLPLEAMGWLLPTLHRDPQSKEKVAEIHRYLANHVSQTAATAEFNFGYSDQDYLILYSSRRDDGLLLEALIETQPDSPLIPKLVRGLLDHRTAGRWGNTQENCWVLLALDKYFQKYENVTPDFVANVWLGDRHASAQTFKGRNKDENVVDVPLSQLGSPLTLSKEGKGRLYYRLGLSYAPLNLKLPPADYGFAVQRSYEAVGDNRDVRRDPDGTWRIKAGSEVKVTVTMQSSNRRYHVALVDPLPAGLEALNPALRGTGHGFTGNQDAGGWWRYHWFQHENLRDERVEAFTQLLWSGVYSYSYFARATTPGNFVVPPAKAEEMYHPETFGRSASDRVIVE